MAVLQFKAIESHKTRNPKGVLLVDSLDVLIGGLERRLIYLRVATERKQTSLLERLESEHLVNLLCEALEARRQWFSSQLTECDLPPFDSEPEKKSGFLELLFDLQKPLGSKRGYVPPTDVEQRLGYDLAYSHCPVTPFVTAAFDVLFNQLQSSRLQNNRLTHAIAKKKTLLVDNGIPTPTIKTALAWWALVGVSRESFISPHLITTPEMAGRKVFMQSSDSQYDHGLAAKSAKHYRGESGKGQIENGLCYYRRKDAKIPLIDSGLTLHQLDAHMFKESIMPMPAEYAMATFNPAIPLPHPYYEAIVPLQWNWQCNRQELANLGLRSLAKWYGVYLRFDNAQVESNWASRLLESLEAFFALPSQELTMMYYKHHVALTQEHTKMPELTITLLKRK